MAKQLKKRFPFTPFPIGWYWIEFSDNIKKGKLYSKQWMGQQTVYWRGETGDVCLAKAICPHLGANLTPERGGKLQEGCLVCPFHGFTYNSQGLCVNTPTGPLSTTVELETYPIYETGGVVFAYWHSARTKPDWCLPELDSRDWSKFVYSAQEIRTHPQETSENGVDITHLPYVHGYSEVESLAPIHVDGRLLQNKFKLTRQIGPSKNLSIRLDVRATVSMWGLGFSMIEPVMDSAGLYIRQLALCTPIDDETVNFVMAIQMKDIERPNALFPGLGLMPKRLLNAMLLRLFFKVYLTDISQDFEIWENKNYLTYPRLSTAENAIIQFRRYCEQFYATSEK